jgi:lipoprotein-anchoring transpeptidase ErfK/SrfK
MRTALERLTKLLALPAAAGLAACGHSAEAPPQVAGDGTPAEAKQDAAAAPQHHAASKRRRGPSFLIAHVKGGRAVELRDRPNGRVVTKLGSTTEFGDPTAVTVVKQQGEWLGVTAPQLPNRKLGWFRRTVKSVRLSRTRTWLRIDLGRRKLQLRLGSRVIEDVHVAVGAPGSPTPTGIYAVTDKLAGHRFSAVYGRFILALSGRQPRTPGGWAGGDRLAIHGTNAPQRIGKQASAGCVEVPDPALATLAEQVPPGAPVVIES